MKNTSFVTCYLLFIEEATSYFGANNCMSSLLPFSLEIRSEVLPAKLFAFHYIYILFKKKVTGKKREMRYQRSANN